MELVKRVQQLLCGAGITHGENIVPEKPESPYVINTKTEVLDFEPTENKIITDVEAKLGLKLVNKIFVTKLFCFLAIAIGTGIAATFVMILHETIAHYKYHLLLEVLKNHHIISPLVVLVWMLGVIIPAMIGSLLVVFIEPKATGGGVAGVIGFVNGVNTTAGNTIKVLVVKVFSVLCTISSGIAGGMEGPMVHIGACLGACMTNFQITSKLDPFKALRLDYHKRDFVGGGMAAGIAGAFFAPIGGFIMALEEGMVFYNIQVVIGILFCCVVCQAFVISVMSVQFGCAGCLGEKTLLYFSTATASVIEYSFRDFLLIVLESVIAGFLGAAWNFCQLKLILFRKIHIKTKTDQLAEMFIIALITAFIGWMQLAVLRENCIDEPPHLSGFHFASIPLQCESGKITGIGGLIGLSQPSAIKLLFYDSDTFDMPTLLLFSIPYFFLSTATMGTFIAGGIFVPNILLGAAWGRFYGEFWKAYFFPNGNFRPHIFAIVGAAAQLCGVIRVPLTLGAIMVETCSAKELIFPIFLAMMITTIVGNTMNHSIYHTQCYMAGMPMIETDPPPFLLGIQVQEVMNTKIVSFSRKTTIQNIIEVLKTTKHNMFPILEENKLKGSIARHQLIQILRHQLYEKEPGECYHILKASDNPPWTAEKLRLTTYEAYTDLSLFINTSPYTLLNTCSIVYAYNIMGKIGSRHIIIVNKDNEIAGILTRKDVVNIRGHASLCAIHVSRLKKA